MSIEIMWSCRARFVRAGSTAFAILMPG